MRSATTSACPAGSCVAMLRLPARPSTWPSRTTTAPTGTSPRAAAAAACRSASAIHCWSTSGGTMPPVPGALPRPEADRVTVLVPGALLPGLAAHALGVAFGLLAPCLRLALLDVGLADDHRLGHVLHGAAGLQIFVDLLAVDLSSQPRDGRGEHQGPPKHQDSDPHSYLLTHVYRVLIPR